MTIHFRIFCNIHQIPSWLVLRYNLLISSSDKIYWVSLEHCHLYFYISLCYHHSKVEIILHSCNSTIFRILALISTKTDVRCRSGFISYECLFSKLYTGYSTSHRKSFTFALVLCVLKILYFNHIF